MLFSRIALTTLSAAVASAAAVGPIGADQATAINAVFAEYDNTRSPGCSLGVIQDGRLMFKRGYGMADLERGVPLSSTSVFRIGSTSKQFTAAVVLLLEQDGKLSLNDDIRRFFPEFREYDSTITIRHLLNHTSGMRDYLTLFRLAGYRSLDWFDEEQVEEMLFRQQELNFLPGEKFLYSNSGYFLLSRLAFRAGGESMRDYARRRIFEPLGMAHTHFHDDSTEMVPNRAIGYAPNGEDGYRIDMTTLNMIGDGGIFTTIEDLLKWDANFYDPRVGGKALLESIHTRGRLNSDEALDYALGLTHGEHRGLKTVSHGGAFVGFRAEMVRFPEQKTSIICLCNLATTNPSRLALEVADIVLEEDLGPPPSRRGRGERPEPEQPREPTVQERRTYAGSYYSQELDHTYRLVDEAGALRLVVGNGLDSNLGVFETDQLGRAGFRLRFTREAGQVTSFELDAGRVKNLKFRRTR